MNFERLGILSSKLIAVHMTQLTDEEIDHCKRAGIHVVHCPNSNLKLASGMCEFFANVEENTVEMKGSFVQIIY